MSKDRESFIASCMEDLSDESRRLVFADWLDENGESELAKTMRDGVQGVLWLNTESTIRALGVPAAVFRGSNYSSSLASTHEYARERERRMRRLLLRRSVYREWQCPE